MTNNSSKLKSPSCHAYYKPVEIKTEVTIEGLHVCEFNFSNICLIRLKTQCDYFMNLIEHLTSYHKSHDS